MTVKKKHLILFQKSAVQAQKLTSINPAALDSLGIGVTAHTLYLSLLGPESFNFNYLFVVRKSMGKHFDFPAMSISIGQINEYIFFSMFPTVSIILKVELPEKFNFILDNLNLVEGSRAISNFLLTIKLIIKNDEKLSNYLKSALDLDSTRAKLIRLFDADSVESLNRKFGERNTVSMKKNRYSNIMEKRIRLSSSNAIVKIYWHPAFKVYNLTFNDKYIGTSMFDYWGLSYNPATREVEEYIIDPKYKIFFFISKKEMTVKSIIDTWLNFIHLDPEQVEDFKSGAIEDIRQLILTKYLTIK